MKKTAPLFSIAILLTLCLTASAFAASPTTPKKRMPVEEAAKDGVYDQNITRAVKCIWESVEREAPKAPTTAAFYEAVLSGSLRRCSLYARICTLRVCEIGDVQKGSHLATACTGGQALNDYVAELTEELVVSVINSFDRMRAEKGLPPRRSLDK